MAPDKMTVYKERLLNKLKENWGLCQERAAFSQYFKTSEWGIFQAVPAGYGELSKTEVGKHVRKTVSSAKLARKELVPILKTLKAAKRTKELEQFVYAGKMHGLCYPLMSDKEIFGYMILCGMRRAMSSDLEKIFISCTESVVRENRKEIELEDINKTIRPRAIALSTVHTVHRLMTSTLDLNELLPRIARLSLQIIRANRCSIKLVDKKKKILLPKATIDLRKEKTKLKKVEIGKYAPGRAVKKEMPIRGEKYLASPMIDEDVVGVITLYDKLDGTEFSYFDEEIMKPLSEQAAIAIKNAQLFKEQVDLTFSSIKCIARLLANRPHGGRKAEASFLKLMFIVGRKFDMNESEIKMLQYAAMLHDAGQISVPERVLMKKGELTGSELDMLKAHPMTGAAILSKFKPLKPIVPIIKYHHENYDGSGYPKGLKGEGIPLSARILAVVGAFESMITERPYRKALLIKNAISEVRKNSGKQFDPAVVNVFCSAVKRKDVAKMLEKELGIRNAK